LYWTWKLVCVIWVCTKWSILVKFAPF